MTLSERKPRRNVWLKAHLRDERGWNDVVVGNISERGVMLKGRALPSRGSFVEIQYAGLLIVGQVRWSSGSRCGVRTQDVVCISGISDDLIEVPKQTKPGALPIPHMTNPEAAVQRSRAIARATNATLALLATLAAGALLAESVARSLGTPLEQVSARMKQR